jgi:glycosyltransferase 2 family protein
MQKTDKFSRILKISGRLLILVSSLFIVIKIWQSELWRYEGVDLKNIFVLLAIGSILYAVILVLLVAAWYLWLRWFGETGCTFFDCFLIYGKTQIAKYLPGNVFHFAGRHVLGRRMGISHQVLIGAVIYENASMILLAGMITLIGILLGMQNKIDIMVAGVILIVSASALFTPRILQWLLVRLHFVEPLNFPCRNFVSSLKIFALSNSAYLIFFVSAGCILYYAIYHLIGPTVDIPLVLLLAINVVAWLAGFLTPGAPAGVGVREAILFVSLSSHLGDPQSLLVVLVFRMITLIGDGLFFLTAQLFWLYRRKGTADLT